MRVHSYAAAPRPTPHALAGHDSPQVIHHALEEPLRIPSAAQPSREPADPAVRLPDGFHGELGRAAGERQVEVGLLAGAAAALDPAEVGGAGELDDLEVRSALWSEADTDVRALFEGGVGLDGLASGEPLGDVSGLGEEPEDFLDRRRDNGGERGGEGGHGT